MKHVLTVISVLIALLVLGLLLAPRVSSYEKPDSNRYYAVEQAFLYGADPQEILKTVECESNWIISAVGDSGSAYSYAQFHRGTFELFKEKAELPNLEYDSGRDQLKLMAWSFANDLKHHWTCAKMLGYTS